VKCYLSSDKEQAHPYACKIIDVKRITAEDLECIHKEVRIHSLVHSEYCVRLHQTIKTSSNIYMVQELCNGFDLSQLLKVKKTLTQEQARLIVRQIVFGIKDIWQLRIIHRDIKLANILMHFPDQPGLLSMPRAEKRVFIESLDICAANFQAKLCDFGLSTILDGT